MNKRQESKAKTRTIIIDKTALLLKKAGSLNISTKDISTAANVSQGSIFLHFKTKDKLIYLILKDKVETLISELKLACKPDVSPYMFNRNYLNVLSKHELILLLLYGNRNLVSSKVQELIEHFEKFTRDLLYENIHLNGNKELSIIDLYVSIDAYQSQIISNVRNGEKYSAISQKKGRLNKLHKLLFG